MATGRIGASDLTSGANVTVYTAPTDTYAVASINICNRGNQATSISRSSADISSAYTITLPANASLLDGDIIQVIDISNNAASNNLTIGRNGSLINGSAENLTIDVSGAIVTLIYSGSTYGWIVGSV